MSLRKTYSVVKAAMYFAVSIWTANRAASYQGAAEALGVTLWLIHALSIASLYLAFMCLRNATRRKANVVTPSVLLLWLQGSKATPVDPDLALTVGRTVVARLTIMACFVLAASLAIWIGNHFAAGHEDQYIYFAALSLGVMASAQIAAIRFGDV